MGKALGAMLPLAAVIIPATIIGAAILFWNAPADPNAAIGARAAALALSFLLHTLIWVGLGLAISARSRTQGTALVVLLAIWFANAFVMPPLAMGRGEMDRSVAIGDRVRGLDPGREGFVADVGPARRQGDGAFSRR
jgi:ABC-type transport system involved in multi-copper enzyme maturation permease subunit